MQILIHAVPARMWYVDGFLVPELRRQGAEHIEIWNDTAGKGSYENWCSKAQAAKKDLADGIITLQVCLERLKED